MGPTMTVNLPPLVDPPLHVNPPPTDKNWSKNLKKSQKILINSYNSLKIYDFMHGSQ